jgi:para-nitrobenzyl esterase
MALPLAATAQQVDKAAPVAHTAFGDLRGAWIDGIAAFLGVPYAAPPVGGLRFAPAAPVRPWSGQRDATRHGPIPPQLPARLQAAMGPSPPMPQDEDCLTLTIRTPAPASDAKARPVVVWLHGGAFLSGAGSLDRTDGSQLAREGDIVFVGVNYRLGALGWLHYPGVVDAEPGMSDIIAALSWVRDHIAGFGGDPSRVTVMGQSAGANAIARMLMMPDARVLFRRAILQSPALGLGFLTSAEAAEAGERFLRLLGIDPRADDALPRLRAMEVPLMLRAQGDLMRTTARFAETAPPFMPLVPTAITQAEMVDAIADGAGSGTGFGGMDVLIGVTADEAHAFFAADPAMENPPAKAVAERFGSEGLLARYRARRPGATAMDLLADLKTDETFLLPAVRLADAVAARGGNAYAYFFDWAPFASRFRSCHTIELPFVFGTFDAYREAPMLAGGDAAQMADLSKAMRCAWISFIRSGKPEDQALPWPAYDATHRPTMRFGARIGTICDPVGLGSSA